MKVSIILPVYNERATVETVLNNLLSFSMPGIEKEIIIIEGNSSDGTRESVKKFEANPGVRIFYEAKPAGRGAAIKTGFSIATGDIMFFQDADLEYSISDYPNLLRPHLNNAADIVIGYRLINGKEHWRFQRLKGAEKIYGFMVDLGVFIYTKLFNLLYGTSFRDGCAMFKVFKKHLLNGISLESNGFDFDWELQGKFARLGFKFAEVPIVYTPRSRAEGKKINFLRDGWRVFWAIIKYRIKNPAA